jgi:hypothetical protein
VLALAADLKHTWTEKAQCLMRIVRTMMHDIATLRGELKITNQGVTHFEPNDTAIINRMVMPCLRVGYDDRPLRDSGLVLSNVPISGFG